MQVKSYQLRALARKTLTFQRRQIWVNVICVILAPMLMTVIAFTLKVVLVQFSKQANPIQEYLYCSKVPSAKSVNPPVFDAKSPDLPITSSEGIPYAQTPNVRNLNFYLLQSIPVTTLAKYFTCTNWLNGVPYIYSDPYDFDPQVPNPDLLRDTVLRSKPKGGWFQTISANDTDFSQKRSFIQYQTYPWALVDDAPGLSSGSREKSAPFQLGSPPNLPSEGFLGNISSYYYVQFDKTTLMPTNAQALPFFDKSSVGASAMDDLLSAKISAAIQSLRQVNSSIINHPQVKEVDFARFIFGISDIMNEVPHGAILFNQLDMNAGQYDYTLQFGKVSQFSAIDFYPLKGLRTLLQQSQLSNAAAKYFKITINQGLRSMPRFTSNQATPPFKQAGEILYPFGVSFLLPIFVIIIVKEKENNILMMMKMNGLKTSTYYITYYLHFYCLQVFSSIIFIIAGILCDLGFFVLTSPAVYIILFLVWGHVQIILAFFVSTLFRKSRPALVTSFLMVVANVLTNYAAGKIFGSARAAIVYLFWPPFAFYRCMTLVNSASSTAGLRPYTLQGLTLNDELTFSFIFLVIGSFAILGVTWFVESYYSGFGFSFSSLFSNSAKHEVKEEKETYLHGEDIRWEQQLVEEKYLSKNHPPLLVSGLSKTYSKRILPSVDDVSFAVEEGTIFGLLGPNGAGKTSLIQMLTGLHLPSKGKAMVAGLNLNGSLNQIYQKIGFCPQHDMLWDDLTVREHLLFYGRLKGVNPEDEDKAVKQSLRQVSLEPFEHRLCQFLSGGERRRVSIAIALVGSPKVVFFDEPTTGLDPTVRRTIWEIIQRSKKGRAVVLTTHSIDEAELLCQKVAIMARAHMRCIGTPGYLKQAYGGGYRLNLLTRNDEETKAFVESLMPPFFNFQQPFNDHLTYEFDPRDSYGFSMSSLLEGLTTAQMHQAYGILEWGINQTSLEDVFMNVISEQEADPVVDGEAYTFDESTSLPDGKWV